ncbi:MAG: cob(I)yrinic acid a,c-diamide adenosyltransferase [Anaerolineaceae bacterium]|nr:cob(I)yrinic acid a,c-diamide adenosyltransferase [Anaerolineaceae bacterium]
MAPFYTGLGDSGDTGYLGEGRISKASLRIEAIGSVDEATAFLGLARSLTASKRLAEVLLEIQKHLYQLMSELAASPENAGLFDAVHPEQVTWLEATVAEIEESTEMPKGFIIPGESTASAALSVARTVVRRAERHVVALLEAGEITKPILATYLNRLSSLLFIMEVAESASSGDGVRLAKED